MQKKKKNMNFETRNSLKNYTVVLIWTLRKVELIVLKNCNKKKSVAIKKLRELFKDKKSIKD